MKHKPYPKYKPSGIDWIGDIPEGWELIPLKHLTQFVNGSAFKPLDWSLEGIPIVRIENLNGSDSFNYYEGNIDNRYYIYKNDLLFGWSGNRGTSFGPFLWWKDGLCYLNQHIFKLVSYKCDKKWLYWSLKAVTHYVEEQAHGIIGMVHITKGRLGAIKIPISIHEQKQIANYLDEKTAQIDDLIQKKEEMIKLLKEKRAAIINQAVTKGLDPNTKMKPSGIDWIGDIPEGWEVRRLRFCLKEPLKYGANEIAIEDDKSLPRYIRISDFDENGLLREDTFRSLPFEKAKDYILEEGDILFARSGATVGKTFQFKNYDGRACFAGYLIKASPDEKVIKSDYVYYFTKSIAYENWKNSIFSQATIQNIGADKYQELVISFPENEQSQIEIINHLEKKTADLDGLINKIEFAIAKLREYRSSLITAAVTGKIDVRGNISL